MLTFLDVLERATNGPMLSVKDYGMKRFIPKVQEVVKKYKIKCDPKTPCPSDDDLADLYRYRTGPPVHPGRSGKGCVPISERGLFRGRAGPGRFQGRKPDSPEIPHYNVGSGTDTTEIEDVHPNKAVLTNGALPIDSKFTCAFGHGMAGITRKEANTIILRLLDKYIDKIKDVPKGKTVDQVYDLTSMKPKEELVKLYDEAVKELRDCGVRLK